MNIAKFVAVSLAFASVLFSAVPSFAVGFLSANVNTAGIVSDVGFVAGGLILAALAMVGAKWVVRFIKGM